MEWVPRWSVWLGAEAIKDGERAPWYLGYAWYLPYSDRTLFLPMPVNWIASWSRTMWIRCRRIRLRDDMRNLYQYARSRGYKAGREDGMRDGIRLSEITRSVLHERRTDTQGRLAQG